MNLTEAQVIAGPDWFVDDVNGLISFTYIRPVKDVHQTIAFGEWSPWLNETVIRQRIKRILTTLAED